VRELSEVQVGFLAPGLQIPLAYLALASAPLMAMNSVGW
jgi:hypothetical protein